MIQSLNLKGAVVTPRGLHTIADLLRSTPTLVDLRMDINDENSTLDSRDTAAVLLDALQGDPMQCQVLRDECTRVDGHSRKRARRSS